MRKLTLLLPVLLCSVSCNIDITQGGVLNHVSIGVSPVNMDDFPVTTKADIEISTDFIYFAWEESDVVGMFPDRGAQAYFEMSQHIGSDVATFDGGGWALKSASQYAVYYPYSYDHKERTSIPLKYQGQVQRGKDNYEHLKAFQHLATGAEKPLDGACNYRMERAEAIVCFNLTLPRVAIYEEVTVKIKDGTQIVTSTKLDVSKEQYDIRADDYVDKFVVSLQDVTTQIEGESVNFYMMMPPQDLSGKKLIVSVNTVEGDCCMAEIPGKNMLNNAAYKYEAVLTTDFGSIHESFSGIDGAWN